MSDDRPPAQTPRQKFRELGRKAWAALPNPWAGRWTEAVVQTEEDLLKPREKICGLFHKRHWSHWLWPPDLFTYRAWLMWLGIFCLLLYSTRATWLESLQKPMPPAFHLFWLIPIHPVYTWIASFAIACYCVLIIVLPWIAIPALLLYDLAVAINPELDEWERQRRKLASEKERQAKREAKKQSQQLMMQASSAMNLASQLMTVTSQLSEVKQTLDALKKEKMQ